MFQLLCHLVVAKELNTQWARWLTVWALATCWQEERGSEQHSTTAAGLPRWRKASPRWLMGEWPSQLISLLGSMDLQINERCDSPVTLGIEHKWSNHQLVKTCLHQNGYTLPEEVTPMKPSKVKSSKGKIVPYSDLRKGITSGISNTLQVLQRNAGGLTPTKRTEINKILLSNDIDIFVIQEANLTHEQLKYINF